MSLPAYSPAFHGGVHHFHSTFFLLVHVLNCNLQSDGLREAKKHKHPPLFGGRGLCVTPLDPMQPKKEHFNDCCSLSSSKYNYSALLVKSEFVLGTSNLLFYLNFNSAGLMITVGGGTKEYITPNLLQFSHGTRLNEICVNSKESG